MERAPVVVRAVDGRLLAPQEGVTGLPAASAV